jgi:drug/metabolite transporter (DMT)-like permease
MDSQALGIAALAATVAMWGMSGVAIKAVTAGGLVTALYRLWFAIPVLWLVMLWPGLKPRLDARWLRASMVGGLLFGIHQILYFTSLKLTSVVNVSLIGALQPALVLLVAGRLFGERVTARAVGWSLVALTGTVLVVLGAAHESASALRGDVLAWVNLFAFTAYFLASKRFRAHVGAWEYVIGMTTVAGLVMLAANLVTAQDLSLPSRHDIVLLVTIAVFPGTLGHVLSNWAHAHVTAFVSSMILLAAPVIATAGAYFFLDERFTALQGFGGAVALFGIAMLVLSTGDAAAEALAESAAEIDAP